MINIFSASDSRHNDFGEGFGNYWITHKTIYMLMSLG